MLSIKSIITYLLIIFLLIQIFIWSQLHKITPQLNILEKSPSKNEIELIGLGDKEFAFRFLALDLQNAGDSFGRFTALKDYDYEVLMQWMKALDDLNNQSNFLPAIASYYYSNTQRPSDNKYIIEYLELTYDKSPKERWWWIAQAVYIAKHKMQDSKLALRLAYKLSNTPYEKLPRWAQQMPAYILEQAGEYEEALAIIKDLAEKYDNYSQGELNFMNHFIKNRLGFLEEQIEKEPKYQDLDPFSSPYLNESE